MRQTVARSLLVNVLEDVELDPEDGHVVRWDYSGRGMYGRVCFGFVGSVRDCARFFATLGRQLGELSEDAAESEVEVEDALEALVHNLTTDDMGLSTIFYFPGVDVEDDVTG